MKNIGFIGAGNMATSLTGGLLDAGYSTSHIMASDPSPSESASNQGIQIINNNQDLVQWADVVILAIKPQMMANVCREISAVIQQKCPLVVSIAAGIRSKTISQWLQSNTACIRVMPNTPSLLGKGMSGLYANASCSDEDIDTAKSIMQTVGEVALFANESMIDAVTAVSGSGPAYFFLFIEALIEAGTKLGLDEQSASLLAKQTALGAAEMAMRSEHDVSTLRRQVTSPGGTTEQAIQTFTDHNLKDLVFQAVQAANDRSVELASLLANTTE